MRYVSVEIDESRVTVDNECNRIRRTPGRKTASSELLMVILDAITSFAELDTCISSPNRVYRQYQRVFCGADCFTVVTADCHTVTIQAYARAE